MATVTLKPNGDGSNPGSWSHTNSNFYTEVDEGIASTDDATTNISQTSSTGFLYLLLEDTPSDFDTATAVEVQVRENVSSTKFDRKEYSVRIYQSDETTAITASSSIFSPAVGYATRTGINLSITGGTSKTVWDGARIRILGGGTDGTLNISTIDVIVTYTATGFTASGGAVGGGTATVTVGEIALGGAVIGSSAELDPEYFCEIVRPNENINTLWGTYDYTLINEVITEPTAGDGSLVDADFHDDLEEQIWGFEELSLITEPRHVEIKIYHAFTDNDVFESVSIDVRIQVDGVWQDTQTITTGTSGYEWDTVSFNGVWIQSDFTNFQVGVTAPSGIAAAEDYLVDTLYAIVCGIQGPFVEEGSGGAVVGGSASINGNTTFTSSGGVVGGGTSFISRYTINLGSGGAVAGGSISINSGIQSYVPSGDVRGGGAVIPSVSISVGNQGIVGGGNTSIRNVRTITLIPNGDDLNQSNRWNPTPLYQQIDEGVDTPDDSVTEIDSGRATICSLQLTNTFTFFQQATGIVIRVRAKRNGNGGNPNFSMSLRASDNTTLISSQSNEFNPTSSYVSQDLNVDVVGTAAKAAIDSAVLHVLATGINSNRNIQITATEVVVTQDLPAVFAVYNPTPSKGAVLTGTAITTSGAFTESADGGAVVSPSSNATTSITIVPNLGAVVSGAARVEISEIPFGGAVASGTIDQEITNSVSGGILGGGTADVYKTSIIDTIFGGVLISVESGEVAIVYPYFGQGGVRAGGTSSVTKIAEFSINGFGLLAGGVSIDGITPFIQSFGLLAAGNASTEFEVVLAGGTLGGGIASIYAELQEDISGGAVVGSNSQVAIVDPEIMDGGVVTGGSSDIFADTSETISGGVVGGGDTGGTGVLASGELQGLTFDIIIEGGVVVSGNISQVYETVIDSFGLLGGGTSNGISSVITTLIPDGDGTNTGWGPTPLFEEINEGVNDSDNETTQISGFNSTAFLTMTDTSSTFIAASSATVRIRGKEGDKTQPGLPPSILITLYQGDESSVISEITELALTEDYSIIFSDLPFVSGFNIANNKTTWDGVTIRLQDESATSLNKPTISALELKLEEIKALSWAEYNPTIGGGTVANSGSDPFYIFSDIGSGGVVAGSNATINADYLISVSGGVVAGSNATINADYLISVSGGVVAGGNSFSEIIIGIASSGVLCGGVSDVSSYFITEGGVIVGGSLLPNAIYTIDTEGGVVVSGIALYTEIAEGGCVVSGEAIDEFVLFLIDASVPNCEEISFIKKGGFVPSVVLKRRGLDKKGSHNLAQLTQTQTALQLCCGDQSNLVTLQTQSVSVPRPNKELTSLADKNKNYKKKSKEKILNSYRKKLELK